MVKFDSAGPGKNDAEIEAAIKQVIDKGLVTEQVIDVVCIKTGGIDYGRIDTEEMKVKTDH